MSLPLSDRPGGRLPDISTGLPADGICHTRRIQNYCRRRFSLMQRTCWLLVGVMLQKLAVVETEIQVVL